MPTSLPPDPAYGTSPGTPPGASIAARWIKANAYAAIVSVLASIVIFGLKQALGIGDAGTGAGVTSVFLILASAIYAVSGAAWGLFTGAVLQRIIPRLPGWAWIVLHAGLAAAAVLVSEGLVLTPTGETAGLPPVSLSEAIPVALALGAIVGAAGGAIESLVLQKAARGLGIWILWSAIAFTLYLIIVVGTEGPRPDTPSFASELGNQAIGFIASVIASAAMLPALRRLEPL